MHIQAKAIPIRGTAPALQTTHPPAHSARANLQSLQRGVRGPNRAQRLERDCHPQQQVGSELLSHFPACQCFLFSQTQGTKFWNRCVCRELLVQHNRRFYELHCRPASHQPVCMRDHERLACCQMLAAAPRVALFGRSDRAVGIYGNNVLSGQNNCPIARHGL